MKKRIIAVLCMLALVVSCVAVAATATDATASFEVGYAVVDMNPYVYYSATEYPDAFAAAEADELREGGAYFIADLVNNETGLAEPEVVDNGDGTFTTVTEGGPDGQYDLMSLPLRGYGDAWNRPGTHLIDDNNDGVVDQKDGLKATCVTVTYDGNTVVFVTMDAMNGYQYTNIKNQVYSLTNGQIKNDQIMISGTYIHTAPDLNEYGSLENNPFDGLENASQTVEEQETNETHAQMYINLYNYGQRLINDISAGIAQAYNDRAAATLQKSQIDASESQATAVYDGETLKGHYTMNGVRHYIVPEETSDNGESYIYGDSFNPAKSGSSANITTVSEVNDTLYLLKFDFEDTEALPVVIANWRAQPVLNTSDRSAVTSDYLNAFRTAIAYNGADLRDEISDRQVYRVAAFQGATGNVVARVNTYNSALGQLDSKWINDFANDETVGCLRGNGYGAKLAQVALECLNSGEWTEAAAGQIRVHSTRYYGERTDEEEFYSDFTYYAAVAHKVYYAAGAEKVLFTYPTDVVTLNSDTGVYDLTETFSGWATTAGTDAETLEAIRAKAAEYAAAGQVYVISSYTQASNILSRWVPTQGDVPGHLANTAAVEVQTHAILLGDNCAVVTSSGNLFDRYYEVDQTVALADANSYNAWSELSNAAWGEPIVMGLCNGSTGMVPNSMAYEYNTGSTTYAVGSFEAYSSRLKQYTGEAIIDFMADQLEMISGGETTYVTENCQHCGEKVEWQPLVTHTNGEKLFGGHYYLTGDLAEEQRYILKNEAVCLDLKGYSINSTNTRCFYVSESGAVMTLMDTSAGTTGKIIGNGGYGGAVSGFGGGTVFIVAGATFNFYSGTITNTLGQEGYADYQAVTAGSVYVRGTMNMYGGTITGGEITSYYKEAHVDDEGNQVETADRIARGGAVLVDGGTGVGTLNVYGGTITSGTFNKYVNGEEANAQDGRGACVLVRGYLNLSGEADIDEIYFERGTNSKAPALTSWLTVQGAYTGKTTLNFTPDYMESYIALRTDVGDNKTYNSVAASLAQDIPVAGSDLVAILEGTNVVIANKYTAEIHDSETREFISGHNSLAAALEAYDGSNTDTYVVLGRNIYVDTVASEDVYLDLNTWNMVGDFQNEGYTLYCMESATDDYTVADGWYGKITGTVTNLEAVPEGCAVSAPEGNYHAGYLQIDEDGARSFHRLNLNIAYLYMDPTDASMNYEGTIATDEKVAQRVYCYGVTMSIMGEPTVTETDGVYAFCNHSAPTTSAYYSYTAGESANAEGTKLINILSTGSSTTTNKRNAQKVVYARAYVQLYSETGEIILGQCKESTLRAAIEALDTDAFAASSAEMAAFVDAYRAVISSWNIPNIIAAAKEN